MITIKSFEVSLDCVHEKCIGYIHGTQFLALTTVYAGIGDVCIAQQVESKLWWNLAGERGHIRFSGIEKGRTYLYTGVAFDASTCLLNHHREKSSAALQWCKIALAPIVCQF